jgi:flavin-dependent dehydrogenase
VRLVDRAQFPRDKLCGDTLNPGTLSILDRLGIGAPIRQRSLAVTGMHISGPGGTAVSLIIRTTFAAAAVVRRELDTLLLEAATAAGAAFEAGVVVRGPLMKAGTVGVGGVRLGAGGHERSIHAQVVIAADGRHSTLAFDMGLAAYATAPKRWAFGAYFIDVDSLSSRGEMHIRPDGYIGVAPLPGGIANVCVVREQQHMRRAARVNPSDVVREAVLGDPILADRFSRARQISEVASLGPLAVNCKSAGCAGLLLAGDAAGFIDPMTGGWPAVRDSRRRARGAGRVARALDGRTRISEP